MRLDDLPQDWRAATLAGRLQSCGGPIVVVCKDGRLRDVTRAAPAMAGLLQG